MDAMTAGENTKDVLMRVHDSSAEFLDSAVFPGFEEIDGAVRLYLKPVYESFEAVKELLMGISCSDKKKKNIRVACEEIFVNIISYSGAENAAFFFKNEGDRLDVIFVDDGVEFDTVSAKKPDKKFQEFVNGGMGITIVKRIATGLFYERTEGKNVLRMKFDLKD